VLGGRPSEDLAAPFPVAPAAAHRPRARPRRRARMSRRQATEPTSVMCDIAVSSSCIGVHRRALPASPRRQPVRAGAGATMAFSPLRLAGVPHAGLGPHLRRSTAGGRAWLAGPLPPARLTSSVLGGFFSRGSGVGAMTEGSQHRRC